MNPPENRFLAFLTSTRNLVGVVLALLGVGAYLLGFLGAWWLPITLGLYLIGVLVTPATTRETLNLPETASAEELRRNLDRYVKMLRGRIPDEAMRRVLNIRENIGAVLPRLQDLEKRGDPNAYLIRQTVLDYLPATLENYLKLPRQYARTHVLEGGKTSELVLQEQLTLLDDTMVQVVADLSKGDAEALIANGRFLQEKFKEPDFKL